MNITATWMQIRQPEILDELLSDKYGLVSHSDWHDSTKAKAAIVIEADFAKLLRERNPDIDGILKELGL